MKSFVTASKAKLESIPVYLRDSYYVIPDY